MDRPHTPSHGCCARIRTQTLAAQLGTSPIVASTFEEVSIVGVFTNLIAVPLSGPFLILGLLGSLAGNLYPLLRPTHNVCDTWLSQDWRETA